LSDLLAAAAESEYWDRVAADPARIAAEVYSDLDLDECAKAILDGIGPWVVVDAAVLEIGCGPGRLTHHLANLFPMVTFIGGDSSEAMLKMARQDAPPNCLFIGTDGRSLGEADAGFFDAAYTMTTFQHIPPEAQVGYVAEVAQVLRPGGRFRCQVVTTGDVAVFNYPTDTGQLIRAAYQVGLEVVKVEHDLIRPGWTWFTWEKT
jgi:SAM-dependent methyltransferase